MGDRAVGLRLSRAGRDVEPVIGGLTAVVDPLAAPNVSVVLAPEETTSAVAEKHHVYVQGRPVGSFRSVADVASSVAVALAHLGVDPADETLDLDAVAVVGEAGAALVDRRLSHALVAATPRLRRMGFEVRQEPLVIPVDPVSALAGVHSPLTARQALQSLSLEGDVPVRHDIRCVLVPTTVLSTPAERLAAMAPMCGTERTTKVEGLRHAIGLEGLVAGVAQSAAELAEAVDAALKT